MKLETHNFEKKELNKLLSFLDETGIYYEKGDDFIILEIDEETLFKILGNI